MREGNKDGEVIYTGTAYGSSGHWHHIPLIYYRDTKDIEFEDSFYRKAFLNHQYYVSETSSPFFEGSYLLAQSAMDNYTALYEAFCV